ncbi:MAG TPA: adenosylcobinamide-GDP ribazoletransferase, partial [Dermatophilaceae bacterium]|nr:adenosylcobinamide-GDP ribazoletransferase [Dermatophilaceae bacterium]
MIDAWRLAVGTLTAWPTRPPSQITPRVARGAMLLAPLAIVPVALVAAVGHVVLRETTAPPLLVGALVVAALALETRGLHLDGLADTCDGLAASYDRTRALEVMRTGDVGPAGAAAIVLVLVIQAAALGDLLTSEPGALVAGLAVVTSRHTLAWACRRGMP